MPETYSHFVPETFLPPVHCPLVIQTEGGQVQAERREYVTHKDGQLKYWLSNGETLIGRYPWTYP